MNKIDLIEELKTAYQADLKNYYNVEKLNSLFGQLCSIATPEQITYALSNDFSNLSGDSLTFGLIEAFQNENKKTKDILFLNIAEGMFINSKDIQWEIILNSLNNNEFSKIGVEEQPYAIKLIEKFWNKKYIFKEEESNFEGLGFGVAEKHTYTSTMYDNYGGSFYTHIEDKPEKLNYLLTQNIPYTQIRNMFFEAIRKEDTRTIGKVLHTKYAYDIANDPQVHEFFKLEPDHPSMKEVREEIYTLVRQLKERYDDMVHNTKDEKFMKHKKI